jgi:hypothetical protein
MRTVSLALSWFFPRCAGARAGSGKIFLDYIRPILDNQWYFEVFVGGIAAHPIFDNLAERQPAKRGSAIRLSSRPPKVSVPAPLVSGLTRQPRPD